MNSMQKWIMPSARFRTVPFQQFSSCSFKNCAVITGNSWALVFSKAYSNARSFSTQWQHRQWRYLAE
jgi:hypothetical protein